MLGPANFAELVPLGEIENKPAPVPESRGWLCRSWWFVGKGGDVTSRIGLRRRAFGIWICSDKKSM
jgi:hypothetical protein